MFDDMKLNFGNLCRPIRQLMLPCSALLIGSAMIAAAAHAVPALQVNIAGGKYRASDQTIVAFGENFDLQVYANDSWWSEDQITGAPAIPGDPGTPEVVQQEFWLSIALEHHNEDRSADNTVANVPADYGSFTIDGDQIVVTANMLWGKPPISDPNSLAPHGTFSTFYITRMFTMDLANRYALTNTTNGELGSPDGPELEDGDTAVSPDDYVDTFPGMYYKTFDIDTNDLDVEFEIHFDAYTIDSNGDVVKFAPFSHDAASWPDIECTNGNCETPEPASIGMLGIALLGLGVAWRRRRHGAA